MNYYWVITRDHTGENDAGVCNGDKSLHVMNVNSSRFSMCDGDNNCYYEGMLYGDYDGFEPLDDFGAGNAGCTGIKIDGKWL